MKEYIYARPDACTLEWARHDEFFRGEVVRCEICEMNPYNKETSLEVIHGTPDRCWDLASRKGAFCSEGKRKMTQEELIRKFGKETVERYLNSCNEDYACGDGDCIFYKEDGCLWHDAEKKEE